MQSLLTFEQIRLTVMLNGFLVQQFQFMTVKTKGYRSGNERHKNQKKCCFFYTVFDCTAQQRNHVNSFAVLRLTD